MGQLAPWSIQVFTSAICSAASLGPAFFGGICSSSSSEVMRCSNSLSALRRGTKTGPVSPPRNRALAMVQPQTGLLLFAAMAARAMRRENRLDVAGEVDGRRTTIRRGGQRRVGQQAGRNREAARQSMQKGRWFRHENYLVSLAVDSRTTSRGLITAVRAAGSTDPCSISCRNILITARP